MSSKIESIIVNTGRLPRRLEDAIDTFYQTWKFARENEIKFDRDLTMTT